MSWMEDAACLDVDPEVFFPVGEEGSAVYERDLARARAVCAGCEVREQCLAYGVRQDVRQVLIRVEPEGVFGGLTARERSPLVKAQMRGVDAA
jgi:WhiB family redox-sensing transcriptional regulator